MMKRPHLDDAAYFLYTGQEDVPSGVTRVRVHSSVRVIRARAFYRRKWLISVEFHDGLEEIGEEAFYKCDSLLRINIPQAVRAIKNGAFFGCSGLTTVILGAGLEEIGAHAFCECRSLVHIDIPPNVRAIEDRALIRWGWLN
jgi:hypothetical protein